MNNLSTRRANKINLKEKKASDAKKRYSYLLGQTDIFGNGFYELLRQSTTGTPLMKILLEIHYETFITNHYETFITNLDSGSFLSPGSLYY